MSDRGLVPTPPADHPMIELGKRLDAIEARQRANRMHDPGCTWLVADMMYGARGWIAHPVEYRCDCWLSQVV